MEWLQYNAAMSDIAKRKQAHINLCLDPASQGERKLFDHYLLPYTALPECDLGDVDTSTTLLGKKLSQPLIIASMTGGVSHAKTINTNLAQAAEILQVAMGVGSQRIALEKEEAKETFALVRTYAPTTVLFANMGAIQLNYGQSIDAYRRVVDMIQADALYLHLNPLQEALQPEGDTQFKGLMDKIATLVAKLGVPVFVKEVGHGLSLEVAKQLVACGVKGIDSAGVGGTSWAWVEAKRAEQQNFQEWFKDFGYPTDWLIEQYRELPETVAKVASGGMRTPIEALKAGILGADYYSLAQPLLTPSLDSVDAVVSFVTQWQRALAIALFACGAETWESRKALRLIARS